MKLIYCKHCKLNSNVPLMEECRELGTDQWYITTRCTVCESLRFGVVSQLVADRFDSDLDAERHKLAVILDKLEEARMKDYARKFFGALDADAIQPVDF